jgi:hypothetical protein
MALVERRQTEACSIWTQQRCRGQGRQSVARHLSSIARAALSNPNRASFLLLPAMRSAVQSFRRLRVYLCDRVLFAHSDRLGRRGRLAPEHPYRRVESGADVGRRTPGAEGRGDLQVSAGLSGCSTAKVGFRRTAARGAQNGHSTRQSSRTHPSSARRERWTARESAPCASV